MKRVFLLLSCILIFFKSKSQKENINIYTYKTWPRVQSPVLSNNGKYLLYTIENLPTDNSTLVIRDIENRWQSQISGASSSQACFTPDNKRAIYLTKSGNLFVLDLFSKETEQFSHITGYRFSSDGTGTYLAYQTEDSLKHLSILNLNTNKLQLLLNVIDFQFLDHNKVLIHNSVGGESKRQRLQLLDLSNNLTNTLWEGENLEKYLVDKVHEQLVFVAKSESYSTAPNVLWYYREGWEKASVIFNPSDYDRNSQYLLGNFNILFGNSGKKIFFDLIKPSPIIDKNLPSLDIWNYRDMVLQSAQLKRKALTANASSISIALDINNKKWERVRENGETIISSVTVNDDFLLVQSPGCFYTEWYWNKKARPITYLLSTIDGSKRVINNDASFGTLKLSPAGKFIIYYDADSRNYFTYEIKSGKTVSITRQIDAKWTANHEWPVDRFLPLFSLAWTENDQDVLIFDQNDLWQIDPKGNNSPICLTNRYGLLHNIEFTFAYNISDKTFSEQAILIQAFNKRNKYNGYYLIHLGQQRNPKVLTMGPFVYSWRMLSEFFEPLKAKDSSVYLVRRMSAEEAPNYYVTEDFKSFKKVTNISPEKLYNWIQPELITWRSFDGHSAQGILYKPENFDYKRKYPVIFYFYEQLSNEINSFKTPVLNGYSINIPLLVSNGYIVFEPDVHYQFGHPGKSSFNYVVSAAKNLTKYKWIDSTKMGIQGHSFGGFEVNYIVSHTAIFKAAMAASGMSDFVSAYGSTIGDGSSRIQQYEMFRDRIGQILSQRPDLYIENSAVLVANKIKTPLLLMGNEKDGDVPFNQSVELFTGMRRLDKQVWMLQYDGEGHLLVNKQNIVDYAIRMKQFFDHYLKNAPAPIWMTQGIPARLKQLETGYAYDPSGNCGKDCKVCKYWNEKFKKDSIACLREINERKEKEHWQ